MANRKEYELLFALNAQMGSGFSGTFKSAQAAIQTTQKEIQELKSAQSDISAYQKQEAAAARPKTPASGWLCCKPSTTTSSGRSRRQRASLPPWKTGWRPKPPKLKRPLQS